MMSSKNKDFTAGDLERYHTGKMLPEERHALEKAALDDPFLADALEGYAFTSTPSEDLAKIRSKLNEKWDRERVVPIFQRYRWLSVAAIVLVIAGAGWLVYSIQDNGTKSFSVLKNDKQAVKDTVVPVTTPQNNLNNGTNLTLDNERHAANDQTAKSLKTIAPDKSGRTIQPQKQLSREKEIPERKESVSEVQPSGIAQAEVANDKGFFKTERGNVAKNNTTLPDPRANNVSEPPAYKDLASNNTPANATARSMTIDTVKNINVVLHPLPSDTLREVVLGYGMQKKSKDQYPHVVIDTLEPAEGYVRFDSYVANNLKIPDEYKTKLSSGEVQLSFDVNRDGQPVNITVVKSLCEKCDEEAIRLLKEGPKWKKKKNKKGKITIRF